MLILLVALVAHADDKPLTPPVEPPPTASNDATDMDEGADLDAEPGHLAADAVPSVLKKNEWAFADCYSRLGGSARGSATITWEVALSGAPTNVKLSESDLKNPMLEACLVKAVQRMKFPEPKGGTVSVSHTFNL